MERDRHGIGRSPVQRERSFLAGLASWMKDRCRPTAADRPMFLGRALPSSQTVIHDATDDVAVPEIDPLSSYDVIAAPIRPRGRTPAFARWVATLGGFALPQSFDCCLRTGGYSEIANEAARGLYIDR
jgi:hypothetical protein